MLNDGIEITSSEYKFKMGDRDISVPVTLVGTAMAQAGTCNTLGINAKHYVIEDAQTCSFVLIEEKIIRIHWNNRKNDYDHTKLVQVLIEMTKGMPLPPIKVDDVDGQGPFLIDGFHKLIASRILGLSLIPCRDVNSDTKSAGQTCLVAPPPRSETAWRPESHSNA